MSDVLAYHPETGATVVVGEEAMYHLRQSGWLLASEHEANQAAAAAAEPAGKAKAKSATSDEEK